MATSPMRPIRLRILGSSGVTNYPNELLADISNKKLTLYDGDGNKTIDFYSELESSTSGTGNAVTGVAVSGRKITITKGSTFLTEHPAVAKTNDSSNTAAPAHGGTFTAIDTITRDTFGHVTKINTKTVTIPSETGLSLGAASGSGNAVTGIKVNGHQITLVKDATFAASNHTHTYVGDGSIDMAPHSSNEVNFGGTNASTTIYFGYRARGSRPIPTEFIFGGNGSANIKAGSFQGSRKYTATLGTSWSGSGPYSQSVGISGISADDSPVIDINMGSVAYANVSATQEAWGKIYRAVTSVNAITFYATEKTSVNIPLQVVVYVR